MSDAPSHVAAALASAAKAINDPRSLDETLDAIVHAAKETVPGFDHVGISIAHRNGKIETRAGTGQLVWELDDIQYRLGEGPCVDSIRDEPVVVVHDAGAEQRWPDYLRRAVEKGLRAQLALRLYTEQETLGGLNLYVPGRQMHGLLHWLTKPTSPWPNAAQAPGAPVPTPGP